MSSYGIMRIEKRKLGDITGLQMEANRTAEMHEKGIDFKCSDIDWTRTEDNFHFLHCDNWRRFALEVIENRNCKLKKNSTVLLDGLYTASPQFFEGKSRAEILDYFKACMVFHEKHFGEVVVNAVVHFDESNYHLHISSVPILKTDGDKYSLSARDLLGGRKEMSELQDKFYAEVGKKFGLDRGLPRGEETKKHLTVQEYKKQANNEALKVQERAVRENLDICANLKESIVKGNLKIEKQQADLQAQKEYYDTYRKECCEIAETVLYLQENFSDDYRTAFYITLFEEFFLQYGNFRFIGKVKGTERISEHTIKEIFDHKWQEIQDRTEAVLTEQALSEIELEEEDPQLEIEEEEIELG